MSTFLRRGTAFVAAAIALAACVAVLSLTAFAHSALAEENDVYAQASAAQQQVEQSAATYDQAKQALEEIEAARKAEEEAAAAAAAAAEEEAAKKAAEEEAAGGESTPSEGDLTNGDVSSNPGSDNVDWSVDKSDFVNQWAGRIDAYLSGSPLSGQGATFAAAAWDYGIAPRFSPAISCVESSKGLYCFRSHNAWGWGSSSWDSWEEAINAHVRGLSRGYGYTVTVEGAKKYCPPNWEFWYSRVCAEMAKI